MLMLLLFFLMSFIRLSLPPLRRFDASAHFSALRHYIFAVFVMIAAIPLLLFAAAAYAYAICHAIFTLPA